jgi:hypothetical protein
VGLDAVLREAIDRQKEPERVVELASQLSSENVKLGCTDGLLLPPRF